MLHASRAAVKCLLPRQRRRTLKLPRHKEPLVSQYSRRDFARLPTLGGSAALLPGRAGADVLPAKPGLPSRAPALRTERYWDGMRSRFMLAPGLTFLNAANLCPTSQTVFSHIYSSPASMTHGV